MSYVNTMRQRGEIERCLLELGYAVVPITGTSMWPLLKEGQSMVQLIPISKKILQKGDIVLYRREDGTLVLHRMIKRCGKDNFLMCGDHQWKQVELIQEKQILGVAQGFYRKGQYIDDKTRWYRVYKMIWNRNLTLRRCVLAFLRLSGLEKRI